MTRSLPITLAALLWLACGVARAAPSTGTIFSCVDDKGRRLTSDRPIAECVAREQRVLNKDGSLRSVLAPSLTADERAATEARERENAALRAAKLEAVRRDRNLMQRYPTAQAHLRAREAALEPVRKGIQTSEKRLAALAKERKPLDDETEFYIGRQMPGKLRQQIDANEASADALRSLLTNQQLELARVNSLYDTELERLKALWAGAAPGSLGPLVLAAAPAAPAASAPAVAAAGAASAAR